MTKTILVADDSKTIQTVVALALRATDFRVVSAQDGDDALQKASDLKPDLVLADVAMPGRSGYELCSALKTAHDTARIPVLLLAGAFEPFDDRRAQEVRADGHLKKPFDSQSLLERVRTLTGTIAATDTPLSFAATLAARQAPPAPKPAAPAPRPAIAFASDLGVPAPRPPAPSPFGPPRTPIDVPRVEPPRVDPPRVDPPKAAEPPRPEWPRMPPPLAPPPPVAAPPPMVSEDLPIDEPDMIEEGDVIEDDVNGMSLESTVPSLEPPTPPAARPRAPVDVWALADEPGLIAERRLPPPAQATPWPVEDEGDAITSMEEVPLQAPAAQAVAAKVAEPVAAVVAAHVPGLSKEELVALAREVIERVAWEVVPELAETIIREELARLTRD